jgi:hypothetical protein
MEDLAEGVVDLKDWQMNNLERGSKAGTCI